MRCADFQCAKNSAICLIPYPDDSHCPDPYNADNKVFVGRMKFNEVRKVAETLRERLNTIRGIEMACQCFDMHHHDGPASERVTRPTKFGSFKCIVCICQSIKFRPFESATKSREVILPLSAFGLGLCPSRRLVSLGGLSEFSLSMNLLNPTLSFFKMSCQNFLPFFCMTVFFFLLPFLRMTHCKHN